jgi:hypothetical protein
MKPETVKDRARQAYLDQQTQDSEGGCGEYIGFIYGFIAGEESAKEKITKLREVLEMVEDNSKITEVMHSDAWTLEYLAERAREVLNKEKE